MARLGALLREEGSRWGAFVLSLDSTASTNDVAVSYARQGAPHGSVVLARRQTKGRGRWRRPWVSAQGGLFMSVVVRPEESSLSARSLALLPLATSVAVAEAVRELTRIELEVLWPNDLLASERKVAGVLCEGSFTGGTPDFVVIGVGLNVNQATSSFPPEIGGRATSVHVLTGATWDLEDVAAAILTSLESWWLSEPERVVARWAELAHGAEGHTVHVQPRDGESFSATTRGISDDGGLQVLTDDGTERVLYSEDVLFVTHNGEAGA